MRYAVASLFTLLVVGAASAVPDDAPIAGRLPTAPHSTRCEAVAEPVSLTPAQWDELRPDTRPTVATSTESVTGVEVALREFVSCLDDRPHLSPWPGIGSGRVALVWVGEPWLLSENRVAVPIATRRGVGAEAWSVVTLAPHGDRYVVNALAALDARSRTNSVFQPALPSGSAAPS